MSNRDSIVRYRNNSILGGTALALRGAYDMYRRNGGDFSNDAGALYRWLSRRISGARQALFQRNRVRRSGVRSLRRRSVPVKFQMVKRGGIGRMQRFRRFKKSKGFGKRKGKHNVSKRGMLKRLWREMHCPQKLKVHQAFFSKSLGHGLRTWYPFMINGWGLMNAALARCPTSGFYWESGVSYGSATTQTPFSKCRAVHFTGGLYKFQLQNRHNWDMHLKVYECISRKDQNVTVANIPQNYFRDGTTYGSSRTDTNLAPLAPTLPTDNLAYVEQNVGFTPYMSTSFCSDFKIIKCHNFKLCANDYVNLKVKLPRKVYTRQELDRAQAASQNCFGGFTKLLLFTYVGGPVDTGKLQTDGKQSTSAPTLAVQYDLTMKYYFERSTNPLYTIASSNATSNERDASFGLNFTTATTTYEVPATETVQTVAGTAATNEAGDNVTEESMAG